VVPNVRLGDLETGGIAPALYALIERGAVRRPDLVEGLETELELRFTEGWPPVCVTFSAEGVVVSDGAAEDPETAITASLPQLVALAAAPHVKGFPDPRKGRGRAALGAIARNEVRIEGSKTLARRLLSLLSVEVESGR
jgi:hypothetical protein